MKLRWGPGPVFAFESLVAARRRQVYVLRACYASLLLVGLTLTWGPSDRTIHSLADAAVIARVFFHTLIVVQLAVVLLAAPAVTAGAVCVDKARGTLLHAFLTDLTDREIVLGKLGARLVPILSLMACGLPVLALGSFLGGIDLQAVLGAELVTAGAAVACSSVALVASVWARKPHQALLLAYALLGLWVGAAPVANALWLLGPPTSMPVLLLDMTNPIVAAFAPEFATPVWTPGLLEQAVFFLATLLIATALVGLATFGLRPTVLAQVSRPVKRERPDAPARLVDYLPGPPLDGNPVLWREWHRKRPSRWTGRFWTAYAVVSTVASLYVLSAYYPGDQRLYGGIHVVAAHVNAWQVAIGLLLLSVSAATTLAEERDRGSLEVILATPLTTREIVWGKWWGTFAMVPRLAILPIWVATGAAMISDGGIGVILMIGLILAYAAAITSIGLALATWIPRLGRVIGATVLIYVLVAVGWPLLLDILPFLPAYRALPLTATIAPYEGGSWDLDGLLVASPFFGVYATTEWAARLAIPSYSPWSSRAPLAHPFWPLFWIAFYSAVALVLNLATRRTFDRCLGRMPQRAEASDAITPRWSRSLAVRILTYPLFTRASAPRSRPTWVHRSDGTQVHPPRA
jgi:ABC-type transport system involved in multi-copper enzyme maturation permease subunit